MSNKKNNISNIGLLLLLCAMFGVQVSYGQEATTEINSNSTYHNQLFFNRFLINPTFSLVRETKSYINVLHRNQYATFEDNDQNYFLGFSNRLNDHTALGISVYSQWSGVVQEFGFNANYATSVKLGDKSKLTFGTNLTYYTEGLDQNRIIAADNDAKILEAKKESKVAIQPGVTLSTGRFDFGLYATDLFKYNQTTNSFLTNLSTKSVKASVQYTHSFLANRGLFANARLMPLLQVGQDLDGSLDYVGSVLLDLPKYGWLQTNFDDDYGLSLGLGFNLSKKMSLGYLLEKDLLQDNTDLGWNHEVSLAYTFDTHGTGPSGYVDSDSSNDAKIDRIVRNYEEQILQLTAENEKANATDKKTPKAEQENQFEIKEDVNAMAYENRLILDELILRQDSIDNARTLAFEEKLESLVNVLRNEIKENMNSEPEDLHTSANTALAVVEETPTILESKLKSAGIKENTAAPELHESNDLALNKPEFSSLEETSDLVAENEIHESVDAFFNSGAISEAPKKVELMFTESETMPIVTKRANTAQMKDYVKLPIKRMNQADIVGVKSGFYLIANVFKTEKYLNAFMESLRQQGLNARQFYNKENGLNYVYLAGYNFKEDAEMAYVSNLNGKYNDEKWIMQIDDHSAVVDNMYENQ